MVKFSIYLNRLVFVMNNTEPVVWSNFVLLCLHVLLISSYMSGTNPSTDRRDTLQVNECQADPDDDSDVININKASQERPNHDPQAPKKRNETQ